MVENSSGSRGFDSGIEAAATPTQGDRQATLLKLAERTVLQAEVLAQEITENARKESEAEGIKILAQDSQKMLSMAQTDSEKMLRKAQTESDDLLS